MSSTVTHRIVVGIFVASIVVSGFLISIAIQKLDERSAVISEIKAEREVLDTRILNYLSDKKFVSENQDLFEAVNKAVPESKDQADLVAELKQFANQSSLVIDSLSFDAAPNTANPNISQTRAVPGLPGVRVLEANVTFKPTSTTNYANVMKFIKKVENNRRLLQINDISLVPDRSNREVLSSVAMKIQAYVKE